MLSIIMTPTWKATATPHRKRIEGGWKMAARKLSSKITVA
jgi:hypothetical protein